MKHIIWISFVLFSLHSSAQSAIPPGTILPVQLNSSINSQKVRVGHMITARVMQDVPLPPSRATVPAGAKVIGHIVAVQQANGTEVSLQFDTLAAWHRRIPITTNLRALASMVAVEQAQIPESGPDRGTTELDWVTERVGGQSINASLLRVSQKFGTSCRGEVEGNDNPQALWVFSSDACGAYGFDNLAITHAGRSNPAGEITLASNRGDVKVPAGSGMLLRVISKVAP